jgi:hypothetical protein
MEVVDEFAASITPAEQDHPAVIQRHHAGSEPFRGGIGGRELVPVSEKPGATRATTVRTTNIATCTVFTSHSGRRERARSFRPQEAQSGVE